MKLYANLHLHSTHSDGVFSPTELVKIAKDEGYSALAITDHDTATAYPELKRACEEEGMECIFGVEFSVEEPKCYHILGFNFDPEYPPMKKYLEDMGKRQTDNTLQCFNEAVENGNITGITWDEVLEYNKGVIWLCNNHVFNAMLDKGLVKEEEYDEWFDRNFYFQRSKYPPSISFLPLKEMVDLIKAAGGFAVWAHPYENCADIDIILESGIVGIEVNHPSLSPEERENAYKIAMDKNLFIAGGSDHSGLCGGYYPKSGDVTECRYYIEPLSAGTEERFFRELQNSKIDR